MSVLSRSRLQKEGQGHDPAAAPTVPLAPGNLAPGSAAHGFSGAAKARRPGAFPAQYTAGPARRERAVRRSGKRGGGRARLAAEAEEEAKRPASRQRMFTIRREDVFPPASSLRKRTPAGRSAERRDASMSPAGRLSSRSEARRLPEASCTVRRTWAGAARRNETRLTELTGFGRTSMAGARPAPRASATSTPVTVGFQRSRWKAPFPCVAARSFRVAAWTTRSFT